MATIHDSTTYRKAAALRYDTPDGDLDGIATRVAEGDALRDVTDAELTRRVQPLMPEVQDLVDEARERHALHATRRPAGAHAAGHAAGPGGTAAPQRWPGARQRPRPRADQRP
jgi:hypothetical protein